MVIERSTIRHVAIFIAVIAFLTFVAALLTFSCNVFQQCYPTSVSFAELDIFYLILLLVLVLCLLTAFKYREPLDRGNADKESTKNPKDFKKYAAYVVMLLVGWSIYLLLASTFSCNSGVCYSHILSSNMELGEIFILMSFITIIAAILIGLSNLKNTKPEKKSNDMISKTALDKERSKRLVYISLALIMILAMYSVLFVQGGGESLEGANHYTDDYLNAAASILSLVFLGLLWRNNSFGKLVHQDNVIAIIYFGAIFFQSMVIISNISFGPTYIPEMLTDEIPGLLVAFFVYINILR